MFDLKAIDDIAFDFLDGYASIGFMFWHLDAFLFDKRIRGGNDMAGAIKFGSFAIQIILFLLLFLGDLTQ